MNNVNILGRLTAAPIPYGSGDKLCARFTVAVPRDRKNAEGIREADFLECAAFGKLGETVLHYLDKGCRVGVTGRITAGSYVDKDGVKRRSWSIICSDVSFCDFRSQASAPAPELEPQAQASPIFTPQSSAADDDIYPF